MECSVCFNLYTEDEHRPLFLNCGHTYCKKCISDFLLHRTTFNCPTCSATCVCEDVGTLPVNFSLLNLKPPAEEREVTSPCPQHVAKPMKFMCSNCDVKFCSLCIDAHQGHNVSSLKSAADMQLDSEISTLTQWESELEEYKSRVDNLSERAQATMLGVREIIEKRYVEAKAKLDAEYQALVGTLTATDSVNKQKATSLKSLLGSSLETVQQWLKKVRHAKFYATSSEAKIQTVEDIETLVQGFSLELPGLTQTFCSCSTTGESALGQMEQSSLNIEANERKVMAWWYMNDMQMFTPWKKELSDKLEREFLKKINSAQVGGYEVDFRALTQKSLTSSTVRKVKRMPLPSWTWMSESSEFKPFTPVHSFHLEQAFSHRQRRTTLKAKHRVYEINLEAMTQKNQVTGTTRKIKRS